MRFLPAALLFITLPFTVQAYTPEISSLPTVAQLRVDPATIAPAISAIKNQPLRFAVGTTLGATTDRSEEHTSELQSLMRISYAVFCLKTTNNNPTTTMHI